MSCAAELITAAASALTYGSMSEEFSGQITKAGCGAVPARTACASSWVRAAWLSSTARRWALKSRPSRGTLPWISATTCGGSARVSCSAASPIRPAANATASAAPAAMSSVGRLRAAARIATVRPNPASAVT